MHIETSGNAASSFNNANRVGSKQYAELRTFSARKRCNAYGRDIISDNQPKRYYVPLTARSIDKHSKIRNTTINPNCNSNSNSIEARFNALLSKSINSTYSKHNNNKAGSKAPSTIVPKLDLSHINSNSTSKHAQAVPNGHTNINNVNPSQPLYPSTTRTTAAAMQHVRESYLNQLRKQVLSSRNYYRYYNKAPNSNQNYANRTNQRTKASQTNTNANNSKLAPNRANKSNSSQTARSRSQSKSKYSRSNYDSIYSNKTRQNQYQRSREQKPHAYSQQQSVSRRDRNRSRTGSSSNYSGSAIASGSATSRYRSASTHGSRPISQRAVRRKNDGNRGQTARTSVSRDKNRKYSSMARYTARSYARQTSSSSSRSSHRSASTTANPSSRNVKKRKARTVLYSIHPKQQHKPQQPKAPKPKAAINFHRARVKPNAAAAKKAAEKLIVESSRSPISNRYQAAAPVPPSKPKPPSSRVSKKPVYNKFRQKRLRAR